MNNIRCIPYYKEIPHKADAAIIVYGNSIPDLFSHSAFGMYHIMGISAFEDSQIMGKIFLEECDVESLLVTFLTELLFLCEKGFKAEKLEIIFIKNHLTAHFFQIPITTISREIKAVTFSGMQIKKVNGYFQTEIVFDL